MSFKSLDININYESDASDLIDDFYIPVLSESICYDRIAGFFTSSSLAISLRGILSLVEKQGKIRIIACPKLTKDDAISMTNAYEHPEYLLGNNLINELECADDVDKDYVRVLGWLISNGILDIKIALLYKNEEVLSSDAIDNLGIFHQKVGIFKDEESNYISFSGSINETLSGWVNNVEEFKTFKSWISGQQDYCEKDILKFNEYWDNLRPSVKVIDLPDAVKKHLIFYGTQDLIEINKVLGKNRFLNKVTKTISLYEFQKEAMEEWIKNDKRMLFCMATGTGKTRTAIACMQKTLIDHRRNLVIISTPQTTLSAQWSSEIEKLGFRFDKSIIADGTNTKWRIEFSQAIQRLNIRTYNFVVIFTSHDTSSSQDFTNIIKTAKSNVFNILYIGDEVHALGSSVRKNALLDCYNERIGLSATPTRWFDDEGTLLLQDYFGSKTFNFGIGEALTTINPKTDCPFLTQYHYNPVICKLNSDEQLRYYEMSKTISRLYTFIDKDSENTLYERKLEERANILKNAESKYEQLRNVIEDIGVEEIKDTLIFVSPHQIDEVQTILSSYKIRYSLFTEKQGTKLSKDYGGKSERQFIIDKFKSGFIKILVAIKCLDEGIDIPTASRAILLSNTTNPREYIQRIGRVIRYSDGKDIAYIYDFIAYSESLDVELKKMDAKINGKEFIRIQYIAQYASNNIESINRISKVFFGG